jgi:hypothetical protein
MIRLSEVTLHPFGKGDLASDGQQFSSLVTTAGDDFEVVESVKVDLPLERGRTTEPLVEVELGLTCSLQSSSTTESVLFKWQYSLDNSTWADLHDAVTYAADASSLKEYSYSGRFPVTTFNKVPFWLRLVIKSGGAGGETAKGKTKNSSYVRVVYSNN